jgi:fibronectin-binding autotransporter adhesin
MQMSEGRSTRHRLRRSYQIATITAAAICALDTRAWAVSGVWRNAASDTWLDSAAWTGGLPVNSGDSATITKSGSSYTVSLGQSLNLGSGSVTVNSTAATLAIASGDILSASYFTFGSGTISGTVNTQNLTLNSTSASAGGLFLFNSISVSESGAGSASNTLQISPSPTVPAVSMSFSGGSINGNVVLASTTGSANTINVGGSSFTSNGAFTVNADPNDSLASDNTRSITVAVTNSNTATMQFNTSTAFSSTLTNQGTVNIATGASLTTSQFVQQSGQLNINGSLTPTTFNYSGGTIAGSGTLDTPNLIFQNSTPASLTFTFDQASNTVSGAAVPTGVTLIAQATASTPTVTLVPKTSNYGTINLTSMAAQANSVTLGSSTYGWANYGTINISPDPNFGGAAGNTRTFAGGAYNFGSVNIPSGSIVGCATFNQAGGTLTLNGTLGNASAGTFIFAGGTITGSGIINTQYVDLMPSANASTSVATALLDKGNTGVTANSIPAGFTLLLRADATNTGYTSCTVSSFSNPTSPVNTGTIRLTSTYGASNSVTLNDSLGYFTNQGLISSDPDPANGVTNTRIIDGTITNAAAGIIAINTTTQFGGGFGPSQDDLINYGTFNVASGATASVASAFNQAGGTINIQGSVFAPYMELTGGSITGSGALATSNLTIGPAYNGSGTIQVYSKTSQNGSLVGTPGWNLPAGTTVSIYQPASYSAGIGSNAFTNNGTLRLASGAGYPTSVWLVLYGPLTNNGLVSFDPDSLAPSAPSTRSMLGTMINDPDGTVLVNANLNNSSYSTAGLVVYNNGTFNVASGILASVGIFNQSGGALLVNGTLATSTFNQSGGTLTVNGVLTCPTFNYSGGTVLGSANIDVSYTLILASTIPSGNSFTLAFRPSVTGTIPTGVNLECTTNSSTVFTGGVGYTTLTNNGRIDLTSNGSTGTVQSPPGLIINNGLLVVDPDTTGAVTASRTLAGSIINNSVTGSIEINSNTILGAISNLGSISIAQGVTATSSQLLSFNLYSGNLDVDGTLNFSWIGLYGGTVTGNGLLSLGITSGTFIVESANQAISPGVAIAFSSTITTDSNLILNNGLSIAAGQTLTKNGAGSLTIDGPQSHGAASSFNVSAGSVSIGSDPGTNLQMLVSAAAVQFTAANSGVIAARNLANLNIGSGGIVTVDSPASVAQRTVLVTSGLILGGSLGSWQGQLDLTSNDLIVHNGGLVNLEDQVRNGFSGGNWAGQGIISSAAAADSTHLTAVGLMPNENVSGGPIYSTFDNQPVSSTDVLLKYTYVGDANLDGMVDGSDYSLIDNGYLNHLTGWYNGDFNYDGVVDGSDYTLIDNAFNSQGAQLDAIVVSPNAFATAEIAGASSVPEPAVGLLGIAAIGSLSRRRRLTKCSDHGLFSFCLKC